MSTIPIGAHVDCADRPSGHCETVIVNPVTRQVTHVVVADKHLPNPTPRLVPLDRVAESGQDFIRLSCTWTELADMQMFVETHYVQADVSGDAAALYATGLAGYGGYYLSPFVVPAEPSTIPIEEERVPPGELAVHRGMQVRATDGGSGHVAGLLVDADGSHISHLLVERGHLYGKKEITVPLSAIDHVGDNTVYLKLDKRALDLLPAIPVKHHWFEHARS
jgi:sporulation protein YlmC with PRC-barrel domain